MKDLTDLACSLAVFLLGTLILWVAVGIPMWICYALVNHYGGICAPLVVITLGAAVALFCVGGKE